MGISISREISEQVKPPRTLFLKYPFGHPFGEVGQAEQHYTIFKDLLHLAATATEPGVILDSPYRWKRTKFTF